MTPSVPLPTLMSWAWCAHTIEIDNEFERTMAEAGHRPRFWVSLVMWTNFLRFIPPGGVSVEQLAERAMVPNSLGRSTLGGLERWGYVTFGATPAGVRRDGFGSGRAIRSDMVVRCTRLGRHAQATWPGVARTVEDRWRARFGAERVDALSRAALEALAGLDRRLPYSPPIVGPAHGFATELAVAGGGLGRATDGVDPPFAARLAQPLVAFTADAEANGPVSLPLGANLLEVGDETVLLRALPSRCGLAKEAVAMAVGWLRRHGLATVGRDPARARTQVFRLTRAGLAARADYLDQVAAVERGWRRDLGAGVIDNLGAALSGIVNDRDALAAGLVPPPGGWRGERPYRAQTEALLANPTAALPRHPVVLHRGGWPDGS